MEKNVVKMSVEQLYNMFEDERKNAIEKYSVKRDSNLTAQRKKCEFVQYLLDSVPSSVVFMVEGCRGDGIIRDGQLANSGSVVECIVKYHLTKAVDIAKSWDKASVDTFNGCIPWEVKASLGSKFLATPSASELTLLVNLDGVSLIKKTDTLNCVNNKGRLPARGQFGNRSFMVEYLEKMLGLEDGYND